MERYLNTTLSAAERAEDLLSKMSLEEKMAQTNCILIPRGKEELAKSFITAGMGEVSTLEVRMMKSKEEAAAWQRETQQMIMDSSEHHIPAIFHMEGLCGAFIQDSTSFPSGIGRASSWNPELEEKIGEIVGRQEAATGFTHTLAPVLDISRDSRMGRQGETYGEDPSLASAMGTAYVKGLQGASAGGRHPEGIAKHFMGFHNSEAGIHGAASDTPVRLLSEVYGKPFQAAIHDANLRGVMPCYNSFDGEPASCSEYLLTDILRNEMGLDGVALSDYSAVENIHNVQNMFESMEEAGYQAMKAGMDIETPFPRGFGSELLEMFRSGKADISILDRAVKRILEAKFRMGLFEHPFAMEGAAFDQAFHHDEDKAVTLQSARESLVLLKNENNVLPIAEGKNAPKKIVIIGPHARNARSFFGGYTQVSMVEAVHAAANSIAGIGDSAVNQEISFSYVPGTQIQSDETEEFDQVLRQIKPDCKNLVEELTERLSDSRIVYSYGYAIAGNDHSHFEEALAAMKDAELCILTLGGKHGSCSVASMGEGVDGVDINLPECQDAFLLEAAKLGVPMVGIHFNGRPISSDIADATLTAILEAWNPSECGAQAIVDVLTGVYNPSGRMPVTTARCAGQIPIYYNHPNGSSWHQGASIGFANYVDMSHKPRYFFGQGLSYTNFAYSNMEVSKSEAASNEEFVVSCTITNTGNRDGIEIVQLYLKDEYASMTRPVMELGGFARAALKAGESRKVSFTVSPTQLAFLDRKMNWTVEKGKMIVMIGSSSEDLHLTAEVQVTDTSVIRGRDRKFYADVTVE
ncbi:MAG: glycoside hydrolase family 3 N-terminal domain-containing protein [Eubacteriales bacterium]|nr:glycoside hydrolase family 3 N-terminal domain-containing protein [Eubacteriales bacterium]